MEFVSAVKVVLQENSELRAARDAVLAIHQPVDALNLGARNAHKMQVCSGCGQDDGNWNVYPCATVRAIRGEQ